MNIFIATVNFQNEEGATFSQMLGAFSTRAKADEAIEDFVEGILLQEYPDCHNIDKQITSSQLDNSLI
ncbi:MAG: hypothetical protein ACI9VT_003119 [Psychroserpens sp.]|jgi:hypothetical protein